MKIVNKFTLTHGVNHLYLPRAAKLLKVDWQVGQYSLWALIDTNEPTEERRVLITGTGQAIYEPIVSHISTFKQDDGGFIWHAFEIELE